jgi:hypothetical protein
MEKYGNLLFTYLSIKTEQTECSETSAYKIQRPGNYPKENIQHTEHGENLKSRIFLFLAGQRFSSNQEAIAAVEGYFADLTKNHYRNGIMALEHRWNKYISLKGDYVEK